MKTWFIVGLTLFTAYGTVSCVVSGDWLGAAIGAAVTYINLSNFR